MDKIDSIIWLKSGTLSVISGCMFAGKTDELIRRMRVLERAGKKIVVFKPKIDNRYNNKNEITTHNGTPFQAFLIDDKKQAEQILKKEDKYDVVAFDEMNFFDDEFWPLIENLLAKQKTIICAGLDKDYWNQYESAMSKILIRADSVTKLFAICNQCGGIATRTQRMKNNKPISFMKPKILIGGNKNYEARCNYCYVDFLNKK